MRVFYGPLPLPLSLPLSLAVTTMGGIELALIIIVLITNIRVALDICPFGRRKCACAGGVGDAGVGGRSVEWQGRE